jgi:hypothetical protein
MILNLEIRNTCAATSRIWLRPGQSASVGRTWSADCVIPDDYVSGLHFCVRCGESTCVVEDLQSRNGTFLNGQRIQLAELHDGDELRAGNTTILVGIDGSAAEAKLQHIADVPPAPPRCTAATRVQGTRRTKVFHAVEQATCPSGLTVHRGATQMPSTWELLRQLAETWSLHLIIAPGWFGKLSSASALSPAILYDWIPASVAERLSPVLASPPELETGIAIAAQAWGHDCAIHVFSHLDTKGLLAHLRRAGRGQSHPRAIPQDRHMFHTCQPSRLSRTLKESSPEFAKFVFTGLDALVCELPATSHWEMLTQNVIP